MKQQKLQTWSTYDFYQRMGYVNCNYWLYHYCLDFRMKGRSWGFIEEMVRRTAKKYGWEHLEYYDASIEFMVMVEKNADAITETKL